MNMMKKHSIQYKVIRSNRKTIAIQITPQGEVVVRCPRRMPEAAVRAFVESKREWIERNLSKQSTMLRLPAFTDGELRVLEEKARNVIPERAAYFAPLMGVTYGRITIRSQRSRWGSCSNKGNLNFNCLLMLAPDEVLDYVVVHELCHRKEMNHSSKFWAEVERVLPDYRIQKKWLRDNGGALIGRIP